MNKKLCCPKCKSKDLQYMVTNETNVTSKGGGYSGGKGCLGYLLMGPLGLLCGACGSKQKITTETKHNAFWVCQGCGNKFKGVNEINEEIEKKSRYKCCNSRNNYYVYIRWFNLFPWNCD